MLRAQFIASRGEPTRKRIEGGAGGEMEVWQYDVSDYRANYYYFADGVLVRWNLAR